ncbi:MAG: 2-oxoacid:acceptor oxidoreductase family protein, partial [bacterium]
FSALIIEGECIHEIPKERTIPKLEFNYDICVNCGLCNICPGIELDENKKPSFTVFCTDCGSNDRICMQVCNVEGAIVVREESTERKKTDKPQLKKIKYKTGKKISKKDLPKSLRIAVRGIGGQGNLFFGKVLSELALRTPYSETKIVKGDTHGMAQLGGPVISVFCCGDVFSPVLAPNSVDILVAMEINEVLRPGFIDLIKPGGTIIFNDFTALPVNARKSDYPDFNKIKKALKGNKLLIADFYKAAYELGDKKGLSANVVALGLVSTVEPCDKIPEEIWLDAISAISPNEITKSANIQAFKRGRIL